MSRLKALLTVAILGTSTVAIADSPVRGGITIRLGDPQPVPRNATPSRHFVRFEDNDPRYDGDDRVRVTQDISGVYDSQYGRVTLTQEGTRVIGTYENASGPAMIKGRLRNGEVHFRWKQADKEGRGVFTVRGRRAPILVGTWGAYDSTTNGGRWTLQPVRVGYRDHDRGYRDHDRGYRDHDRGYRPY